MVVKLPWSEPPWVGAAVKLPARGRQGLLAAEPRPPKVLRPSNSGGVAAALRGLLACEETEARPGSRSRSRSAEHSCVHGPL